MCLRELRVLPSSGTVLCSHPSSVCSLRVRAKAAKQVAERKRLIKTLYGVEPDELLLDSIEYRTNTGSFAVHDPFHVPTPRASSSSSHSAFAAALSRLSFYARTLLSHLPFLRPTATSLLPLHHAEAGEHRISHEEEEVMLKKV
jgi:hypothetical protein